MVGTIDAMVTGAMTDNSTNTLPGAGLQDNPSKVIATASGYQIKASMNSIKEQWLAAVAAGETTDSLQAWSIVNGLISPPDEFEPRNYNDADGVETMAKVDSFWQ